MNTITPNLLNDTLNLVQLVRETALAKGNQTQAERLSPVVSNLKNLVQTAQESNSLPVSSSLMSQDDFRTMLSTLQQKTQPVKVNQESSLVERNRAINGMSAGGMADIDIARQMGLTREEVRTVLNLSQASRPGTGVFQ
jgi:DNA-binding NarL/FixJ family response regulator